MLKLNIPPMVKIGNREVKVVTQNIDPGLLGMYLPDQFEIQINASITNQSLREETFFHELIHAIQDYMRFTMSVNQELQVAADDGEVAPGTAYDIEEGYTEQISKLLLQVIIDNDLFIPN